MSWSDGVNAGKWIPVLNAAEVHHAIPKDLLARQCYEESRFNPEARNPSGAIGIMQLLPKYFPGAGRDPLKDISTAAEYLRHIFDERSGGGSDWQLALAGYDWGPTAVEKAMKKPGFGLGALPSETQKYVTQIIGDVPVPGVLCKIPSLPSNQTAGSLASPSSEVTPSEESLQSWWSRLSSHYTPKELTTTQSLSPSALSALSSLVISSQTENQGVNKMSTANPILKAAAPTLIEAVKLLQTAINTILTGDPLQIPLRAPPAAAILVAQLQLLLPELASAETITVNAEVNLKLNGLVAKLQAINAPPTSGQVLSAQSISS